MCRWRADDTRVRFQVRFHWQMTYVIHTSSAHRLHDICTLSGSVHLVRTGWQQLCIKPTGFLVRFKALLVFKSINDKVSRESSRLYVTKSRENPRYCMWQSLARILDSLRDKVSREFSIFYMTKSRENSRYFTWQSLARILDIVRDKVSREFSIFCVTNSRKYHWKQSQTNSAMTENKQNSIVLGRLVRVFLFWVLKLGEFI